MHNAAFYPDEPALSNQEGSTSASDNSLKNLLPNQLNIITSAWLSHLVQWQFSGNEMRVLNAVFRHTIGFWKHEDDMNGARLQQITKIRYDHVNVIVKKLAAKNILILRKGFHGFWMSINFNFSTWGKSNIDIHPSSNDPTQLLPEETEPVDTGYCIDNPPETTPTTEQAQAVTAAQLQASPEVIQSLTQEQAPPQTVSTPIQVSNLSQAQIPAEQQASQVVNLNIPEDHPDHASLDVEAEIQQKLSQFSDNMLSEVTQHMEDLAQTLGTTLDDKIKKLDKFEARMNMLEAFSEQQFSLNQHNQIGQVELDNFVQQQTALIERHQQENREAKIASEALFMQQRQSAQAELEHLFRQERDIDQNELKQLFQQHIETNKVEIENFIKQQIIDSSIINQSISPVDPVCEIALESLTHDQSNHDYEQYQAEYSQYTDPIENSDQSTQKNKIEITEQKPEPHHNLYHIRLQELKQAYDKAKERYSHYESHFSQIAEKEDISFEQAIANENKQDFWEGIVNTLNTAHQDIEEYVQESPV